MVEAKGRVRRRSGLWLAATLTLGCAAGGTGQAESPSLDSTAAPPHGAQPRPTLLEEGTPGSLAVPAQALALTVPDRAHWVVLPASGTWSRYQHEPSQSVLWLRHRVARRSVTVEECEKEARASLSLLRGAERSAWQEMLPAPRDYLGHVETYVLRGNAGLVLAVGAGVSRCYAAVFWTPSTAGWAERLELASSRIFPSVRLASVDERGLGRRFEVDR